MHLTLKSEHDVAENKLLQLALEFKWSLQGWKDGRFDQVWMSLLSAQLLPGLDPVTKVRGGDFSNIWQSSLITGSLRDEVLHNTAVRKQWTTEQPYIANVVF